MLPQTLPQSDAVTPETFDLDEVCMVGELHGERDHGLTRLAEKRDTSQHSAGQFSKRAGTSRPPQILTFPIKQPQLHEGLFKQRHRSPRINPDPSSLVRSVCADLHHTRA